MTLAGNPNVFYGMFICLNMHTHICTYEEMQVYLHKRVCDYFMPHSSSKVISQSGGPPRQLLIIINRRKNFGINLSRGEAIAHPKLQQTQQHSTRMKGTIKPNTYACVFVCMYGYSTYLLMMVSNIQRLIRWQLQLMWWHLVVDDVGADVDLIVIVVVVVNDVICLAVQLHCLVG